MKTYLPHYFKRIGILFVFIAIILSFIGGVDDFRRGWVAGQNDARHGYQKLKEQPKLDQTITPYLTEGEKKFYVSISLFFSITGFFLYLFSKEKVDDEFMQHLRLKSMLQAFMVSWIIYGTITLIFDRYELDGIYILQLQLLVYVIIFWRNKNRELSEEVGLEA